MFTFNITFVVAPEKEEELLQYLRKSLIPSICNDLSPAKNPELKKLIEASGEKPGADHALSIALALSLSDIETAHQWNEKILIPALGDFHEKFGENALFFVTLLENLTV